MRKSYLFSLLLALLACAPLAAQEEREEAIPFGNMDQWHMKGEVDPVYARAVSVVNAYLPEDDKMRLLSCSSSPNYYSEAEIGSDGKVDYSYRVLPVKPYVGIGFGRMLPKRKLGCHFDLGILYRGRWKVHCDGYYWDKDIVNCIKAYSKYLFLKFSK